jgi:hypothetical protein
MKSRVSSFFLALGVLCIAGAAIPGSICAQAPAGPLPAAQPQASQPSTASPQNQQPRAETRTSIVGQWKLDPDESDDPRKKMQDASASRGSGSRGGSGVSIAGVPIGGHGGYGGSRGGESDEERLRTQSAIAPANSDEKSPHGGKMSRTFELSYDGTQLFETVRLTMGRSNTPLDVRYVYDPVSASGSEPNP